MNLTVGVGALKGKRVTVHNGFVLCVYDRSVNQKNEKTGQLAKKN